MKKRYVLPLALSLSFSTATLGQESSSLPAAMNVIMVVTDDGEVQLYEAQQEAPMLMLEDPDRPGSYVTLSSLEGGDPQAVFFPPGYHFEPGSQGSMVLGQRVPEERQRSVVGSLVDYASNHAIAAAEAFCGSQNMRPESISVAAGAGLQVSVTWNVERACQAGE
ncbi:hypothetical protein [Billgrantia aerodenitrificans]|jgi:hypothetical protein|uniref:Uncharacterized protein n=1 Tax=Billgrantia aerodenitrificans TaxID=2733483 RepID=A0ABS9AVW4_9GAMM|nr:hypothetical protein [Halomonas aerodenitrificans]MCE8025832.1 hypothetical protein [Halomonas aerodenitrificans]